MKRGLLLTGVVATMVAVSALALQERPSTLQIAWAARAAAEPPVATVLLEFGMQDNEPVDWTGRAAVSGAKVVHREGYRFRTGDKLLPGDTWQAFSHRPMRAPKGNPVITRLEGMATVGIVLHLQDITPNAAVAIEVGNPQFPRVQVPLADVFSNKPVKLWNGAAQVRLLSTTAPVELSPISKTEDDYPAAAYGPDGTLWVAYVSYKLRDETRRIEQPSLTEPPTDFKAFWTPEFGDQLLLKYYRDGDWSQPIRLTSDREDIVRCAVAVTGEGEVCVVYSANRGGNYDLYARSLKYLENGKWVQSADIGAELRITTQPGPDLTPVMCTDRAGNLWLACQSWNDKGQAGISISRYQQCKWQYHGAILGLEHENCWHPAIAADNAGNVAIAYDIYRDGNYDVFVSLFDIQTGNPTDYPIATSARFEARPSLVFQNDNLWIAYEEGPEKWGKDYGALDSNDGKPLYNERSVRVVGLQANGGKHQLVKPLATLPTSRCEPPQLPFDAVKTNQFERTTRAAHPQLGIDLNNRVWLAYRLNFGSRYSSHPGAYWLTYVRRLEGNNWSESVEVHHSDGLLDHRPVLLPHKSGGLLIIHNTDGRYSTPEVIDNQIYASLVNLPGQAAEPACTPLEVEKRAASRETALEREAVNRIRSYRIENDGKRYQILRGEYHRHTELSWDGAADGSLEDMFRYAIDAAAMDWIGNGDHDNGAGREYPWWLVQKFTDAYHAPGVFTPMFTYERSVPYPHGHRNCMFAKRGVRTLPRLAAAQDVKPVGGIHADDTKMLYRYLRELDGICAMHTSATGMGTDWRDNDPLVEPIVEIYQGDRMSYEHEGAPRAGFDPQLDRFPANLGGWEPKGFINLALEKGYRLGFQASSDHWSTHISYFMVLAEKADRESILQAVKKRHVYAATDNIIVDVRSGNNIMGDEFETPDAPKLEIKVHGTTTLAQVEILRDSLVVAALRPQGPTFQLNWADPQPQPGTHYYYIRVTQADGELAWSSPMWVKKR